MRRDYKLCPIYGQQGCTNSCVMYMDEEDDCGFRIAVKSLQKIAKSREAETDERDGKK